MAAPYSGYAARQGARYSAKPSVPGINPEHLTPEPDPDPFQPQTQPPANQGGTILVGERNFIGSGHAVPSLASQPIHHWYDGQPPVPSGVETASRMQAMQERMMLDHADTNYVPDSVRLHKHAGQGQANEWITGRPPQNAGEDPGERLRYLVMGRNSYDATNEPNEVYQGDAANVGRYRLGVKTNVWGLYEAGLGRYGQDALLRAYTGLSPATPVDKPRQDDTAPYTANSTGTARWAPTTPSQTPSTFALPGETSMTEFAALKGAYVAGNSEFEDTTGGY